MSKAIEDFILSKLAKGPLYANTFRHAKPVVERLVRQGRIRRIAPEGKSMNNMLALTERTTPHAD